MKRPSVDSCKSSLENKAPGQECHRSLGPVPQSSTGKGRGLQIPFVSLLLCTWYMCQGHTGGNGL